MKAANDQQIATAREAIQPAIDNAGEMTGLGTGGKAIATLDASMASQQFAGRSCEVDLLTKISDSSSRKAERLERMTFEGIPGGWSRGNLVTRNARTDMSVGWVVSQFEPLRRDVCGRKTWRLES
ncbi:hypothetical protein [Lacipirellula parvula]|uniref:hypothetical protein n=1 Tax=Lacipirellula parvula TaxID=2650471 RepID=UPI001260E774|nr:hypothetical protein [Lacipirellula parvula]